MKHPLEVSHIQRLFNRTDQYLIPYQQKHAQKFGLILYNPENRCGAAEEASLVEDGLVRAGINVDKQEWRSEAELYDNLNNKIDELLTQGLSLLVISIMAHGRAGVLGGSNGSLITITGILSHLKDKLPEHLPLVKALVHQHTDHCFKVIIMSETLWMRNHNGLQWDTVSISLFKWQFFDSHYCPNQFFVCLIL